MHRRPRISHFFLILRLGTLALDLPLCRKIFWDIFEVHFFGLIFGFAVAACLFSPIPLQALFCDLLLCDNKPCCYLASGNVDWCVGRDDLAPPSSR